MSIKYVQHKHRYECESCGKIFYNKQSYQGISNEFRCAICDKVTCKKCNKASSVNRICRTCMEQANLPELRKTAILNKIMTKLFINFGCVTFIAVIVLLIGIWGKTADGTSLLVPCLLFSIPVFILQVVFFIISNKLDKKQFKLIKKIK